MKRLLPRRACDGNSGSVLTRVYGVSGEPDERGRDADTDDEDEPSLMRLGIQELLPLRSETMGGQGGMVSIGWLPFSICSRTEARVRPSSPHQSLLPAALFLLGVGGGTLKVSNSH